MKWLSYHVGGRDHFGFVEGDYVIDYATLCVAHSQSVHPRTLLDYVEAGPSEWAIAAILSGDVEGAARHGLDVIKYHAPIRRPSKILGVPINNGTINRWAHRPWKAPGFFLKPPSALIGHGEAIVVRRDYGLTHPEPELAAIIGKRARNVAEADALDYVFGYTAINDITSPVLKEQDSIEINMPGLKGPDITWRELRGEEDSTIYLTYHARSKGCDTFAPMGPWIVTADAIADPDTLAISGWLGEEKVTVDTTANLSFGVAAVIAQASRFMTLEPGDVVHFGMAAVSAMPEKYPNTWSLDMASIGGSVAVEIEGIGILINPIVTES
jgi:2-keto-4-pentenoate hydratase/2-oxohepta-3-ene-1,7-dioic acid hydratase in catechol pathway